MKGSLPFPRYQSIRSYRVVPRRTVPYRIAWKCLFPGWYSLDKPSVIVLRVFLVCQQQTSRSYNTIFFWTFCWLCFFFFSGTGSSRQSPPMTCLVFFFLMVPTPLFHEFKDELFIWLSRYFLVFHRPYQSRCFVSSKDGLLAEFVVFLFCLPI